MEDFAKHTKGGDLKIRSSKIFFNAFVLTVLSALLLAGANGMAHDHSPPGAEPANLQATKTVSANVRLYDLELTNQESKTARFKSDVIGDRIVVLDNIYTTCTTICPVLTAIMGNVHRKLGERAGKEVFLVSLSVDPVRDTPQRLKAYARRHKAAWTLWTGQKTKMDQILKGLGIYTPEFIDHPSSIMVGDGKTGEWTRFYGFVSPDQIVKKVDELLSERQNATAKMESGK